MDGKLFEPVSGKENARMGSIAAALSKKFGDRDKLNESGDAPPVRKPATRHVPLTSLYESDEQSAPRRAAPALNRTHPAHAAAAAVRRLSGGGQ